MTDIQADDAGKALKAITMKLLKAGVLEQDGVTSLLNVASGMVAQKRNRNWLQEVDRGNPVRFKQVPTSDNGFIRPKIDFARIGVNQSHASRPPFDFFDVAIVVEDGSGTPLSRWHLDFANQNQGTVQSGPLFHLQFGGRNHGFPRSLDHPVKEPRWCHPPMELALVCELIIANFFEDEWIALRDDPSWCHNICMFQSLCFENYLSKLQQSINTPSGSTILKDMWASNWN